MTEPPSLNVKSKDAKARPKADLLVQTATAEVVRSLDQGNGDRNNRHSCCDGWRHFRPVRVHASCDLGPWETPRCFHQRDCNTHITSNRPDGSTASTKYLPGQLEQNGDEPVSNAPQTIRDDQNAWNPPMANRHSHSDHNSALSFSRRLIGAPQPHFRLAVVSPGSSVCHRKTIRHEHANCDRATRPVLVKETPLG
jgi:hypothetical protein